MHLIALAEALSSSRRPNGAVPLEEFLSRLSRAGLEEYSRAALSLAERATPNDKGQTDDPYYPWV